MNSVLYYRNRKERRDRMLRKLANTRAAKARKRLASYPDPEPKFLRWYPLEFGVRDKMTGEFAWVDLKSVRQVQRALTVILKFYVPGRPNR